MLHLVDPAPGRPPLKWREKCFRNRTVVFAVFFFFYTWMPYAQNNTDSEGNGDGQIRGLYRPASKIIFSKNWWSVSKYYAARTESGDNTRVFEFGFGVSY